MLLGFKRRFAPYVEDGTKQHSIRARRSSLPKIGEMCHCYADPRQRSMRLLGRWPCTRVETIVISKTGCVHVAPRILVQDWLIEQPRRDWGFERLSLIERDLLAWRDGFRHEGTVFEITDPPLAPSIGSFALMMDHWKGQLPFMGYIIHWSKEPRMAD